MTAEDYDIKVKYLAAKAGRQGGTLGLQDAVEFHEALISQLQLEMARHAEEIGKLKAEISEMKKEK
jgi:hypothetical protein